MKLTGKRSKKLEGDLLSFLTAVNADLEEPEPISATKVPPIDELLFGVDLVDIAPTILHPQVNVQALGQNYLLQPTMPLKIKLPEKMHHASESLTTQKCKIMRKFQPIYPKVFISIFVEQSLSKSTANRATYISYSLWLVGAFGLGLLAWIFLLR